MVAWAIAPDARDELPEVEVFVPGPDGEPLEFPDPATPQDVLRDFSTSLSHGLDHLKEVHATSGQRLGAAADRATRHGSREDIITPLLVSPSLALEAVANGLLFDEPLDGVDIDAGSGVVEGRGVSWQVTVSSRWRKRRSATLWLYSSPSANLTVLELIPNKPRLIWTWSFVSIGVAALDELGRRLAQTSPTQRASRLATIR